MARTHGVNATLLYGKMPYSHLNNNTCRCVFVVGDRSDVWSCIFGFSSTCERPWIADVDHAKHTETLTIFTLS